jgi:thioredoxin 2
MSEAKVVTCKHCGQKNRVRAEATGAPHCGKCGRPLPWVATTGSADFAEVVERSPLPVLVDFWAPWCGPCKIVEPAVERISEELAGKLKVGKVNTDLEPALSERFGIRGIPTLILFEDGRERDRVTGALGYPALKSWVDQRLSAPAPRSGPAGGR